MSVTQYVPSPCQVTLNGPFGSIETVDIGDLVCTPSDAQKVLTALQKLYTSKLSLFQGEIGAFFFTYPSGDDRRIYLINDASGNTIAGNVEELIIASNNWQGVNGNGGSWQLVSLPGFPPGKFMSLSFVSN